MRNDLDAFIIALMGALQVALVDAFGIEDYVLNSALGRQDGDVYTALLDMAQVPLFLLLHVAHANACACQPHPCLGPEF
eukprot:1147109-Pelagomonas_calceolata.AAC.1